MPITTRKNSLALGAALLAAVGVVVSLTLLLRGGAEGNAGPVATPGAETALRPAESRSVAGGASAAASDGVPEPRREAVVPGRLLCLRASDGAPVAGLRLYAGIESVAGPSGADGVLEIPGPRDGTVTVWAEGWIPQEWPGNALPVRVLLEAADATVEVHLQNLRPGHRVQRSLLQRRGRLARAGGPWIPRLESWSADRYGAAAVPAGTYDVYLWVGLDDGAPRPYVSSGVEVLEHEVTVVELDLATPPAPEADR